MNFETSIDTILISDDKEISNSIKSTLNNSSYKIIFEGPDLQPLLTHKWKIEPQLIIAVMNNSDNGILSKFKVINQQFPIPIVIFSHDDQDDAIEQAMEAGVSAYVVDGFSEARLQAILKIAITRFRQYQLMQEQITKLKTTLAERKIIDRAKGLIMEQRHCTEDEAYRMMRTSAMNQNMRLAQLAHQILTTASLLETEKQV